MKRLIFLIVVVALGLMGLNALTITVGGTTETVTYFPIYTWYGYNYTQQIYTQAQINYQGPISKIRFFRSGTGSFANCHDWVIYMGHTARTSFSSTSDWEPVANLTQVFSGSVLDNFPNPGEWMEITLNTPFNYNNTSNLIVAIHETTPSYSSSVPWGGFTSTDNVGIYYYSDGTNPDPNSPPDANNTANRIASIQLVFPDTSAPQAPELVSPENGATIMNGQILRWTLPQGSSDASGYDVYIDGAMVADNQAENRFTVGGLSIGTHTWYVVARNNIGTSPPSETRNFTIASGVQIGDGTAQNMIPVYPFYGYNYTQSIFLQSEINIPNQRIESIAYYWNGAGVGTNTSDWVVYMGHVQRNQFNDNTDWVPVGEMVQVFNGHLDIPAVAGWIEIELDFPFVYNNTDNLVIAVDENTPAYDGSGQYFYSTPTTGQNRSMRYYNDSTNPDPASPPNGTLVAAYPNILMQFGDLPTAPILRVSPVALNFGTVMYGQPTGPLTVMATNVGSGTLNLSAGDVSIIGTHADEFTMDLSNLPANLGPGQYVQIPVTVTGVTAGEISATLRIVYGGENHDVALTANVLPAGTVMIGSGTQGQRQPFGTVWGHERSATLYTVDQIGTVGFISMVGWDCSTTSNTNIPYKIWAKNTTETTMSAQSWQSFTNGATMLKEGTFTPNTSGWNMFELDTPFAYTGSSLIIGVESNYGGYGGGSGHNFRYTNIGEQRHQMWYQDSTEPTGSGNVNANMPNIMMHLTSDIEDDIGALSIIGNLTPTVGIESVYTVRVRNNGSNNQNTYQVKLMGPNNTELVVVNGPPLNSGLIAEVELAWTPTTAGTTTVYGKVEMDGDELAQNNQTNVLNLNVQPEGIQAVTIGTGTELARIPMDFWMRNSLYQTLYYPDELGFTTGTITSIALYNQFSTAVGNGSTQIYMGSTNQTDLSNGYISATELTLVYDGNVDYPTGDNTILISLQTPFMYMGGNLVIMFNRMDTTYYSSTNYFKCQTVGNNRARNSYTDGASYDPYNPPTGSITNQFPMTTLFYTSQLIENDLGAMNITGNSSPTVGISSTYTVRVKNNGTAAQNNYTVKLLDADNTELASVAGPAINSQQIVEVEIPWTPTVQGTIVIHGKVELTGDQIPTNNSTRPMSLMVNPAGVISYTVGDGSQTARIPVDMWWRNSLFETIYFPNEMGGFIGQITGLKFYNQFNSNLTQLPITIWLGTTTLTSLNDGYIPSTQLTEVFNGPVDFPSGENIISIIFNEPYLYLDGNNLVMLVHRADTTYYSSSDFFKAQTVGSDRSRNTYSDSDSYDPANPPAGTLSGQFPMTTFMVIPGGVGHISGTVTNASNQPISGATVSLNNGQYSTTTNASGQYQLINVLPDTYTLAFSAHGYYEHTQTVVLEEDDDLTINVTLQLLPQVSVTGTVLASDTGAGISGAAIQLRGYEPYDVTTNAAGVFTIPNVFADHTYDYNISAIGYTSANGQVVVGTSNHNMGAITLNEVAYAPVGVTAEVNDGSTAVNLNWLAPDPNALEIVESFEAETFPPEDWSQIITNDGPPNALGVYPTWSRIGTLTVSGDVIAPTDGDFQAGLFWDYAHQDEWLITPPFNCPPSAYLRFDGYVYCGSTNGDHYYVKVSSDNGTTWTVLWDATAQTPGWNEYSSPITIDLSAYSGNQIKLAFHAEDPPDNAGLWYAWYIDNVYIGNSTTRVVFSPDAFSRLSAKPTAGQLMGTMPLRALSRRIEEGGMRSEPRWPRPQDVRHTRKSTRVLTGYMVYRLQSGQEQNETQWVTVTDEPVTELTTTDPAWATLANGDYRWAVKAVYTNGVTSVASFSNILNKYLQTGMIVGTVRRTNNTPIVGASVTNGTVSATTNSMGAYTLTVPIGYHSVTASAVGYDSLTVDDVIVNHNLATTVNFILKETPNEDDYLPVLATALNGNYPNPFNPETTISYSLKEAGRVKLEVYNIKGQLVRSLVDEVQATGHYKLVFNAKDDRGRSIASGVYMLKMSAPGYKKTTKMILMQ